MKEFIKRTISVLLIIASLLLLFLPSVIKIDGIKSSEWREIRNEVVKPLERGQSNLIEGLNSDLSNASFKYDLKDSGMPYTASSIKRTYKTIIKNAKELLNNEISFKEIITLAFFIPKMVDFSESMLEFSETPSGAMASIEEKGLSDFLDTAEALNFIFAAVLIFFAFIILLGVFAAVTEAIGKLKFVKYVYFAFILVLSLSLIVVPFLLDGVIEANGLLEPFSGALLRPTLMPFAVILLSFSAIIVPAFFKNTSKKNNIKSEVEGK